MWTLDTLYWFEKIGLTTKDWASEKTSILVKFRTKIYLELLASKLKSFKSNEQIKTVNRFLISRTP